MEGKYFILDQLFHILVILFVWLYLSENFGHVSNAIGSFFSDLKSMTILTAFVIVIWPAGIIIGKVTEPLRSKIKSDDSLPNAGMFIGLLATHIFSPN